MTDLNDRMNNLEIKNPTQNKSAAAVAVPSAKKPTSPPKESKLMWSCWRCRNGIAIEEDKPCSVCGRTMFEYTGDPMDIIKTEDPMES